jgi:hypothetical protein
MAKSDRVISEADHKMILKIINELEEKNQFFRDFIQRQEKYIDALENLPGLKPLPPDKPVLRLVKGVRGGLWRS